MFLLSVQGPYIGPTQQSLRSQLTSAKTLGPLQLSGLDLGDLMEITAEGTSALSQTFGAESQHILGLRPYACAKPLQP